MIIRIKQALVLVAAPSAPHADCGVSLIHPYKAFQKEIILLREIKKWAWCPLRSDV